MNLGRKTMGTSDVGDRRYRRGFLKSMLLVAGGMAVAALPACSGTMGADGDGTPEGFREFRPTSVPLRVRSGLRYQNTMPSHIPAVRLPSATASTL
jgi:hypothetical protein